MADKKITRQLSIFINDKEVVNSLGGITKEITRVKNEMKNLNKGSDDYEKDLKRLNDTLGDLTKRQNEFKEEIADTNAEMGAARENFGKLFSGLAVGDMSMAKEGLLGIKGAIVSTTKAGLAFIATPIGAAIAVLAGIAVAGKALFDFNNNLRKSNDYLVALGVNADELSKVRAAVEATAETFEKSFEDIASKANSLAKTYQISMSEANDIIAKGLADGGAQNEEFLDSLGEYDEFFAKAGYSASEFIDIINQGFDAGIYTDKLPDALKEADLSLKEQTKTTRDALVNAFGASFTDEILNKVSNGEMTTKEALDAIAAKATETGITQQQQAQLTADVFRGAGEDAGGAMKIFEVVAAAANRELSAASVASLELTEANKQLNEAQANLFGIEGFGALWDNIKAKVISAFADMVQKMSFVRTGLETLYLRVRNTFTDIKNTVITNMQAIISAIAPALKLIGKDAATINKELDSMKGKQLQYKVAKTTKETNTTETVTTTGTVESPEAKAARLKAEAEAAKAKAKKAAEEEKARQKLLDAMKATEEAKIHLAKAELDNFIANSQSKIEENKLLTTELVTEEIARLAKIRDLKITELESDRTRKKADAEQRLKDGKITEEGLVAEKKAIDLEYETSKQALVLTNQKETAALQNKFDQDEAARKAEALVLENELKLAEAETKSEEDRIKEDERYQQEKDDLQRRLDEERLTKGQHAKLLEAAAQKHSDNLKAISRAERDAKLAEYGEMFGNIAALLGENTAAGKAAAIANVAISQGLAVARIWEQPSTLPSPFDVAAKVAGTAVAVANVIAAIKQVTSVKVPKTKNTKFFHGGYSGNKPTLGYDEYGPVTGVVHKNEWIAPEVMTQDPQYAATFSWLEGERQRKLRKFADGGESTSGTIPNVQMPAQQPSALEDAINRLNQNLERGIVATTLIGYEEAEKINTLNTEQQQSKQNGIVS